ncbi:MAG: hypothetical protein JWQ44_2176 [Chthoniobacter sp.]|nr:hypothetical protein [Chthoniobacter sp.]
MRSFVCAFRGLGQMLITEANARIHAALSVMAICAGWWWDLSPLEWCAVVGAIGLVAMAEAFNTALEVLVDLVSPELHPLAGRTKDLAAGAVLCAALAAAAIGMIVFGPRLLALLKS